MINNQTNLQNQIQPLHSHLKLCIYLHCLCFIHYINCIQDSVSFFIYYRPEVSNYYLKEFWYPENFCEHLCILGCVYICVYMFMCKYVHVSECIAISLQPRKLVRYHLNIFIQYSIWKGGQVRWKNMKSRGRPGGKLYKKRPYYRNNKRQITRNIRYWESQCYTSISIEGIPLCAAESQRWHT